MKNHEKAVAKYKQDLDALNALGESMLRRLVVYEIEDFKAERTASYYAMVQHIAREEMAIIEKERDFWMAICSNSHLQFEIEE